MLAIEYISFFNPTQVPTLRQYYFTPLPTLSLNELKDSPVNPQYHPALVLDEQEDYLEDSLPIISLYDEEEKELPNLSPKTLNLKKEENANEFAEENLPVVIVESEYEENLGVERERESDGEKYKKEEYLSPFPSLTRKRRTELSY